MENAVDALIIAGSVLLLIIALTVSISSFTALKVDADRIIKSDEQIDLVRDQSGGYINYIMNSDDIRVVNIETIISTVRRLPREQYNIYIYAQNLTIDNTYQSNLKNYLIKSKKAQLYGNEVIIPEDSNVLEFTLANSGYKDLNDTLMGDLYTLLKNKNKKFKEYIGIYQIKTAVGVEDVNKDTYRVITFVEEP